MKKLIATVLFIMLTLSLIGCGNAPTEEQTASVNDPQWGITLEVKNITANGLTIVCHQSGGKNVSSLITGTVYGLQKRENSEWVDISTGKDIAWTTEAWPIQNGGTTEWDVNWTSIYGTLSSGEYRIGKPISNFRGTGDYETQVLYAEFTID